MPQPPVVAVGLCNPPKEDRRDDKHVDGGDSNANKEEDKDKDEHIANVSAVCPSPLPLISLLLPFTVTIGGVPPSKYSSSRGMTTEMARGQWRV